MKLTPPFPLWLRFLVTLGASTKDCLTSRRRLKLFSLSRSVGKTSLMNQCEGSDMT